MNAVNQSTTIYTVGKLTRKIKSLLEERFPFLWITGEISNLAVPASGHAYFSLKDDKSIISGVMFKGQRRKLTFALENGTTITGMARLALYEPRGSYQLIFEHMAPEGAGALQAAFEQLKKKLANEGLFDTDHKKALPFLPEKINVITSGTGAAVRDIIHVAGRRFPGCPLEIVPVRVQGQGSENEIARAITQVNALQRSDLIILARGGGSLEDLWAFNTEVVARAICDSKIPIISGIGHETDFTIADFVSDMRAPTPSAAAQMALPDKKDLLKEVSGSGQRLSSAMGKRLEMLSLRLDDLSARLKSPDRVVQEFKSRVQENGSRINVAMKLRFSRNRERLFWLRRTLDGTLPRLKIPEHRHGVANLGARLNQAMDRMIQDRRARVNEVTASLMPLSPQAVLDRGYSITRRAGTDQLVMAADDVQAHDRLEIILSKGRLVTRVE